MEDNYFTILWFFFAIHPHELTTHVAPPSWTPLPPPSPSYPSGVSQRTSLGCLASCIRLALVICFVYGNIHVLMLFSQIIPPLSSLTELCKEQTHFTWKMINTMINRMWKSKLLKAVQNTKEERDLEQSRCYLPRTISYRPNLKPG